MESIQQMEQDKEQMEQDKKQVEQQLRAAEEDRQKLSQTLTAFEERQKREEADVRQTDAEMTQLREELEAERNKLATLQEALDLRNTQEAVSLAHILPLANQHIQLMFPHSIHPGADAGMSFPEPLEDMFCSVQPINFGLVSLKRH